jgi:ABC-2 type transport system permease protein
VARALGTTDEQVFTHLRETLETAESEDSDAALEGARELEATLEQLEAQVTRARDLDPDLLVSPFGVRVMQLNDVPRAPGIFYSPGTLALLVQHLALTFAALSLVRERELGLTEVFRVSPLGTTETLAGKYLGFGAIALVVSAALTGAMLLFGVRIRGSMLMYVLVVLLLIVASLGLGFLLSGASKTDSQAVQYSMIALLLSIFFTGFVLPLDQLAAPVQAVSYLIPATYGIRAFHDIFFRGASPDPLVLGGLALYAVALAAGAWWVVKREVASVKT